MRPEINPLAPRNLVVAWLAAAASLPFALAVAVLGQALGAMAGGCSWIGITLPLDRPVWALVNEPSLHFASLGSASGYWLGSTVLPLLAAFAVIPSLPRPRTVAAELGFTQFAWANAAVGLAWLPLLDLDDGHLARWLDLHHLPAHLLWLAPALSIPAAVLVAIRLLSLTRATTQYVGPFGRLITVAAYLLPVPVACIVAASTLLGAPPMAATIAIAIPVAAAFGVALRGLPPPYVHSLRPVRAASVLRLVCLLLAAAALLLIAGRPLPQRKVSGLLWGRAFANNNIRPWVETARDPAAGRLQPGTEVVHPSE
jgi:hypothetical protein